MGQPMRKSRGILIACNLVVWKIPTTGLAGEYGKIEDTNSR
jgi:hypothetical protein